MHRKTKRFLLDIFEAAQCVTQFLSGETLHNLQMDKKLRAAVYMQFVIIGEAVTRLRELDPNTVEQISEYWRITGFRNQIVHGYFLLDDEITWRTIQTKLPILIDEVGELLKR